MQYFLPIFCFVFMLSLAQYESSLYSVTFCMAIAYLFHKATDHKEDADIS